MQWRKISNPIDDTAALLAQRLNVPKTIAQLLVQRGITDFESAKQFFRPQ